jgi:hypothetical protein
MLRIEREDEEPVLDRIRKEGSVLRFMLHDTVLHRAVVAVAHSIAKSRIALGKTLDHCSVVS